MIKAIFKTIFWIFFGLIMLVVLVSLFSPKDSTNEAQPDSTEISLETESASLKTEEELRDFIISKLESTTNRDTKKVADPTNDIVLDGRDLYVMVGLSDNFSNSSIISGGWNDIDTIIRIAKGSGLVDNLTYNGTFPLQDKYGNSVGESIVMTVNFLEDSIPKINTEAFVYSMYEDAASSVIIHPALQGE
jgi:hypothetical protein